MLPAIKQRSTIRRDKGTIFSEVLSAIHAKEITPPAPLERRAGGKVLLACDHCGLQFWRKASYAKKHAHSYCGKGCSSAAQIRRIEKTCIICGVQYLIIPAADKKWPRATCGESECIKKRQQDVAASRVRKPATKRFTPSDVAG